VTAGPRADKSGPACEYMFGILDYSTWIVSMDGQNTMIVTLNGPDQSVVLASLIGQGPQVEIQARADFATWKRYLASIPQVIHQVNCYCLSPS
jgi:hypothetical protein